MGLFTDEQLASLDALREYESGIAELLTGERIELAGKLRLAHEDVGAELTTFLAQEAEERGGTPWPLTQVVVTPSLRQWEVLHALELIYRDAYNSHLNDRYLGKWKEYGRLAKQARGRLYREGVGVTRQPIPKAAPPRLSAAPGAHPGGTFWVRVSWTGGNEEGAPSEPVAFSTPPNTVLAVAPGAAPAFVDGWNVYAGILPEEVTLQNDAPLRPGAMWTLPASGLRAGRRPGTGQAATDFVRLRRLLLRG
ncbi:MAG: hypothetical protein RMK57_16215 [Bryobacterales bacterium]|nr:hypothetical protein [Bryobacteraceae bacterium]MDW8356068.1 hypothetical protein [Bryobacterales bacterium]